MKFEGKQALEVKGLFYLELCLWRFLISLNCIYLRREILQKLEIDYWRKNCFVNETCKAVTCLQTYRLTAIWIYMYTKLF